MEKRKETKKPKVSNQEIRLRLNKHWFQLKNRATKKRRKETEFQLEIDITNNNISKLL